jgi:hypothetical protein
MDDRVRAIFSAAAMRYLPSMICPVRAGKAGIA